MREFTYFQYDLNIQCGKCHQVLSTALFFNIVCTKVSLNEVVPLRPGNSRAGHLRSSFPNVYWYCEDNATKTTFIRQDIPYVDCERLPSMALVLCTGC